MTILGLASLAAVVAAAEPQEFGEAEIWFEDLVTARALAETARDELTGTLLRFALHPSTPVETPASLAADREPRMVFLTLSDGTTRGRMLRAAGRGASAVIRQLRKQVEELTATGFSARVARFDLVSEVRKRRTRPAGRLPSDRSLFGLAFERGSDLAFLADEVVADTLINSDQELRLRNVAKRPDAASWRTRIDSLREAREIEVFRFATTAWAASLADSEPVALVRGHRSFRDLDPEMLLRHAVLAGDYLARAVEPSGRFVYSYLPKTDRVKDKYNALRHCGTVYSMLELYAVTGDAELLAAAERAIGYLREHLIGRCTLTVDGAEIETACVVEDGEVKLGGNALAIVALAQHAAATGEKRHLPLIDELGRWILATQAEDGEFLIHKQSHPEGVRSSFISGYYPGEALLALARRPEPDPAWLDATARGARWLIEVRDGNVPTRDLNHDHWLLYALNEIHRQRPDPIFPSHAERITRAILDSQRRDPEPHPDWVGSYYTPPRSTPTATRSEGLGAAYLMMQAADRHDLAAPLLEALELGVRFQLQTQFLPESCLYVDDPARVLGGFHRSLTNYEIRIDYVQHNISALLLLRRILLDQKAAAVPAKKGGS